MNANVEMPRRSIGEPRFPAEEEPRGRFILKDGSVVDVRDSGPDDRDAMRQFFATLSPESRYHRFVSLALPGDALIERLCDSSRPADGLTLIATRADGGTSRIVGTGSYFRLDRDTAEAAFAVGDAFQARGIGTGLLERLAIEAARNGIRRFQAITERDNTAMVDVLARSGFKTTTTLGQDSVTVDLDLSQVGRAVQVAERHEAQAVSRSITPFFRPNGIAVIGVSESPSGIGRRVFDAIRQSKYKGALFAVNGKGGMRGGIPTHATVRKLPLPVELAVIAVPSEHVADVMDDCGAAGVKAVVVISAGFAEVDRDGREQQRALVQRARGYGMRVMGPNCLGLVNADPRTPLNASFSPIFPPSGHLALASQSGALGVVVLGLAAERGIGISSFASLGNKADVSGNDLLQYWEQDASTTVIGLYLESFGNPRRFARLAKRVGRAKPIIAVKAGRTYAGSRAAGSHTAALAASDAAVDALFRQTGVIRAATIDELLDTAACLESQPLPAGRRVAIVTNAGGPGILAADACEAAGLAIAKLSDMTIERLGEVLPRAASLANPIDMVASASAADCAKVVEIVLADSNVDALVVIHTGVDATADPEAPRRGIHDGVLAGRSLRRHIPVVACVLGDLQATSIVVGAERVPVFTFPENAVRALGHVADYAEWLRTPAGDVCTFEDAQIDAIQDLIKQATTRSEEWLSPGETRGLLGLLGAPHLPTTVAETVEEALEAANRIGYPVVAKMRAGGLVHKTEAGGVVAGIADREALRTAFATLEDRAASHGLLFEGIDLQPMVTGGIEAVVGVTRDAAIGGLVGVGMGGTEVEVIGDVEFGLAPLTDRDADRLIDRTRLKRLLAGYRGRPAADRRALVDLLLRLSELVDQVPEILELDLNPVMVLPEGRGCVIVDARVRISKGP
jgi:acetate---CoA ligase (ADP-forming)